MNKVEHLLICLIEECSELQKEITKVLRFGFKEDHPELKPDFVSNVIRLKREINDIYAILDMLVVEDIDLSRDEILVNHKLDKLSRYMEHSKNEGLLE